MSRIIIVGAGAIGSFFGARLHEDGHDVTLIARGERLERLRADGVAISEAGGLRQVRVPARSNCDPQTLPDHVVLATKTFQLESALATLDPYRDARFGLLTVQNGVEAPGVAQAHLPQAQVFGARLHGFFELEAHLVQHKGVPVSIMLGPPMGSTKGAAREGLADDLTGCFLACGVQAESVADIRPALWDKFLMAATLGGVAPAFGLTAGQVYSHNEARHLLAESMGEVAAVAAAIGVRLPPDAVAAKLDFISRFPPHVTSSLQRDLEAGLPSEFAQLTGAIPRFAKQIGVSIPATDEIIQKLQDRGLGLE